MPFRLRYQAHDFELPQGEFAIGRATECQLSLDDPLVSRRHAILRVTRDLVTVEDLGSRNGVLVGGERIRKERNLVAGDRIQIGSQEMVLVQVDDSVSRPRLEGIRATQTYGAMPATRVDEAAEPTVSTELAGAHDVSKTRSSFALLGGVADKAFAMNRAEEAERVLRSLLLDVLRQARAPGGVALELAEQAARYAARLATATGKGGWLEYTFELYGAMARVPPAPIVDEMYTVIRKVKAVEIGKLRAFVSALKALPPAALGPNERFLMQRLEGLERLATLK